MPLCQKINTESCSGHRGQCVPRKSQLWRQFSIRAAMILSLDRFTTGVNFFFFIRSHPNWGTLWWHCADGLDTASPSRALLAEGSWQQRQSHIRDHVRSCRTRRRVARTGFDLDVLEPASLECHRVGGSAPVPEAGRLKAGLGQRTPHCRPLPETHVSHRGPLLSCLLCQHGER